MRPLMIVVFVCYSLITLGQAQDKKVQVQERIAVERNPRFTLNDTTIDVVYQDIKPEDKTIACFLDKDLIDYSSVLWINPNAIKDVKIIKRDTVINDQKYSHQLHVKAHDSIPVNLMSLSEIKRKYIKPSTNECIYVMNNRLGNKEEIITTNPETKVDRNYIFRIKVDELNLDGRNPKRQMKVDVIRILFRTKENIENANKIWIR
jgi:hypothetical protein